MKRFLIPTLFIVGCAQNTQPLSSQAPTSPSEVNPKQIETIFVSSSAEDQKVCETELHGQGAKILYKGENGVLFTDSALSSLSLKDCKAIAMPNEKVTFTKEHSDSNVDEPAKTPDLSTLLRLIPAEEIGARTFIKNNPTFDGRNAIVAVLDTGVEVDHPMLRTTTTGETKVIAFDDFSGEGQVTLTALTESTGYKINDIPGTDFNLGQFAASNLSQAEELSHTEKFQDVGVITYLGADQKRHARIDTNGNKDFTDEKDLLSYDENFSYTKLGEKKSLSVSVAINEDGKALRVCFDDGSHGTHVAGISTGYDPKGLIGVAPGAKVIAAKIGDNRLAGGSTTTASMMLAIDYAVSKKANIINLSYGIRAGSNLGKSAIDRYVDKVAKASNILFSISAGNEGPGLLTIGVPAGADLAITNGAYVSAATARDNYGYSAVEHDTTWYFSSVGPRLDGGLKPTLLAPGSALASVPNWKGLTANYRGTSMASPQTTGGLALLVSAATQSALPIDRATITQSVYSSAKPVKDLTLIEQGHGLFNVPAAFEVLKKKKDVLPVEYKISVNSPTSPEGKGAGIYVRSKVIPENKFTVTVTPDFPQGTSAGTIAELHTYKLVSSDSWIKTLSNLWLNGTPKTFQVNVDAAILEVPGIHSGKISAVDEVTGEVAFIVPVTVIGSEDLTTQNNHTLNFKSEIRVNEVKRVFVNVPTGTTSLTLDLESDGPIVWGQLLDNEGRKVAELRDTEVTTPQPILRAQATIKKAGVYEVDLVAPGYNRRRANVSLKVRAYSITAESIAEGNSEYSLVLQNNFGPVKVVSRLDQKSVDKSQVISISGIQTTIPFVVTADDAKLYSDIQFEVTTSKKFYDLMTDYPFRVFSEKKEVLANGGLELNSKIELSEIDKLIGTNQVEITGAFTEAPKTPWGIKVTERRILKDAISLYKGPRLLLETGQAVSQNVSLKSKLSVATGFDSCAVLSLEDASGRLIQELPICL